MTCFPVGVFFQVKQEVSDEPEIPLEEIQKDKKVRGSLPFPLFLEVMFIFSHEPRKNPYDS